MVYNGYPFKLLGGTPARLFCEQPIILMGTRDGVKTRGGGLWPQTDPGEERETELEWVRHAKRVEASPSYL